MKAKQKKTTRELIKAELELLDRKPAWLAKKSGISPTHLSKIFKHERNITAATLAKINAVLETDFELK